MARRILGDADSRLAADRGEPRADGADDIRCHPDRLVRPQRLGGRRARHEFLFRLHDLRHRARHRHRPDDRSRTWAQASFGARRAPHRAAGFLGLGADRPSDLGRPLERRSHAAGDAAGTRTRGRRGIVCARAAVGAAAFPVVGRPALLRVGAGAAALGAGDRACGGSGQRGAGLVADVRRARAAGARPRRHRDRDLARQPFSLRGAGAGHRPRSSVPALRALRSVLAIGPAAPAQAPAHRPTDRRHVAVRGLAVQRRRVPHGDVRRARSRPTSSRSRSPQCPS